MTAEIEKFKAAFRGDPQFIHLNNAGTSLLSLPAKEALMHWTERFCDHGSFAAKESIAVVVQTRAKLARLLGANETQVGFFQSTACALSQLAFGLEYQAGDEILTWDQEYPANFYPWRDVAQRTGAKLVLAASPADLSTPLEALLKHVTPKTKVIAISWVQFSSGAVTDLKALAAFARERGILTFVDAVQGVGLLPFDFTELGLDAVCGGSHKWLVSPLSVGYLCARGELIKKLKPLMVGAMTYGTPEDPNSFTAAAPSSALRFEAGSRNVLTLAAFGASLDLILETGVSRIAQETEWLARKLSHGLRELGYVINTPHGKELKGSIVNFSQGPDSRLKSKQDIAASLSKAQVSFAARNPGIRLSPHAYNTEQDLKRVLQALS